jgi:hypothetical protein
MDTMSTAKPRSIRRRISLVLVSPFLAIALYILSIGPVFFIWHVFKLDDQGPLFDAVWGLYKPLLDREHTPFGEFLSWYANLWVTAAKPFK